MPICITCDNPFPEERAQLGYGYCTKPRCVSENFTPMSTKYTLMLMPKQGYVPVRLGSEDLKHGKSSGRQ